MKADGRVQAVSVAMLLAALRNDRDLARETKQKQGRCLHEDIDEQGS